MLTSEFNHELGTLIRSMEQRVIRNPHLTVQPAITASPVNALDRIEEAIISLVALHIMLRNKDAD